MTSPPARIRSSPPARRSGTCARRAARPRPVTACSSASSSLTRRASPCVTIASPSAMPLPSGVCRSISACVRSCVFTLSSSAADTGACASASISLRSARASFAGGAPFAAIAYAMRQAGVDAQVRAERRRLRDLAAIHERLVQPRRLAVAEQRGGHLERRGVGTARRRREPRQRHRRQRHVRSGLPVARGARARRLDGGHARNRRRRPRDRAEILVDPRVELLLARSRR